MKIIDTTTMGKRAWRKAQREADATLRFRDVGPDCFWEIEGSEDIHPSFVVVKHNYKDAIAYCKSQGFKTVAVI